VSHRTRTFVSIVRLTIANNSFDKPRDFSKKKKLPFRRRVAFGPDECYTRNTRPSYDRSPLRSRGHRTPLVSAVTCQSPSVRPRAGYVRLGLPEAVLFERETNEPIYSPTTNRLRVLTAGGGRLSSATTRGARLRPVP